MSGLALVWLSVVAPGTRQADSALTQPPQSTALCYIGHILIHQRAGECFSALRADCCCRRSIDHPPLAASAATFANSHYPHSTSFFPLVPSPPSGGSSTGGVFRPAPSPALQRCSRQKLPFKSTVVCQSMPCMTVLLGCQWQSAAHTAAVCCWGSTALAMPWYYQW